MSDNPFANPEADRYFATQPQQPPQQQIPIIQPPPAPAAPAQAVLDDYNPFAGSPSQPVQQPFVQPHAPPAAPQMAATQPANSTSIDTQELQRRQEELERKAAELMRKEQELNSMQAGVLRIPNWPPIPSFIPIKPCVYMDIEAEIPIDFQWLVRRIYHYFLFRVNNFPPLPAFIKVKPCFYQDITVEIPVEFQRLVTYVFYYWLFNCGFLFWDLILALTLLCLGDSDGGASFGICVLNFVLCTPLAYICWFRPLYKAFRDDSSVNFFFFFIVFAVQFVIHCLHGIGIPGYVYGFINGFEQFNKDSSQRTAAGIVSIISGGIHGAMAAVDALILLRVHAIYRSSGASLQKAQAEFATGVMSNKNVQNAAAQAAQVAAQNAVTNATTGTEANNRF